MEHALHYFMLILLVHYYWFNQVVVFKKHERFDRRNPN